MFIHLIRIIFAQLLVKSHEAIAPAIMALDPTLDKQSEIIQMVQDDLETSITEAFLQMRDTLSSHLTDASLDEAAYFTPGQVYELLRQLVNAHADYQTGDGQTDFEALRAGIVAARGSEITEKAIRTAYSSGEEQGARSLSLALELITLVSAGNIKMEENREKYTRLQCDPGVAFSQLVKSDD